jgi:hypothetical protein
MSQFKYLGTTVTNQNLIQEEIKGLVRQEGLGNNNYNNSNSTVVQCASEQYRPSNRYLSAKLVSTFADRQCHVISVTNPYSRIIGFLDRQEGLGNLKKNSLTSSGLEPTTFRLVALCLNHYPTVSIQYKDLTDK